MFSLNIYTYVIFCSTGSEHKRRSKRWRICRRWRGSRLNLPNSRRGKSRGDPRLYRSQIGHSLRKYLLKRRCVLNIINILISATIYLMTRGIFVKFPTILLKEMYNALGIDISDNQRTNVLFLIHEILYQSFQTNIM
jgi:hypothetical protein